MQIDDHVRRHAYGFRDLIDIGGRVVFMRRRPTLDDFADRIDAGTVFARRLSW